MADFSFSEDAELQKLNAQVVREDQITHRFTTQHTDVRI